MYFITKFISYLLCINYCYFVYLCYLFNIIFVCYYSITKSIYFSLGKVVLDHELAQRLLDVPRHDILYILYTLCIHICISTYIYIYIYVYTLHLCNIYIYIYIYIYMCGLHQLLRAVGHEVEAHACYSLV